ncbi:hypothetical protein Y981_02590 [Leptospirillum ferriphilum YSK]|uniref:Uncharacterized protein n=2 Tax=Leptospirillum ferriphilum TaxID=178606 RepID=A0A059Y1X7_9BACT|nr:hypothetical protein Y981_02590 [Leptospirillum ferriphilum YSK]
MANLTPQQLAAMSPDQLFAQLGTEKVANMHAVFGNLNLKADALTFSAQDTTDAGRSFFEILNQNAYNFFCGNPSNQDGLAHLLAALNISKDPSAIIAAVSGVLTAYLGLGPIIAMIVAALLIKVVFPAVITSLCNDWKNYLNPPTP